VGTLERFFANNKSTLRDGGGLFSFFWTLKRWWMVPMQVLLFPFGALVILAQSSAIAPFLYTLF
jgi:hypothetical protein